MVKLVVRNPYDNLIGKKNSKGLPTGITPLEPETQTPMTEWTDEEIKKWRKEHGC